MLDIEFILENKDLVKNAIVNKKGAELDFSLLEQLYEKHQALMKQIQEINRQRKIAADERDAEKGKELKQEAAPLEKEFSEVTKELTTLIAGIPNIPLPDVPIGETEDDNVVVRSWGEKKDFSFKPKPHWELGKDLDIIDTERAAKVSGSRFTYLKGNLVRMQFALLQWTLDMVTNPSVIEEIVRDAELQVPTKPFTPVLPPVFLTPNMLFGMARLDPREDKYFLSEDDLFLAGSAEHTLGSMHADEVFDEKDLPIRYIGYSTAFRREAGSYGKDTKGILRQHQFDKLEFETFTVGEKSREEQDFLVAVQEYLVRKLELPYQVVAVCTGDMGGPDLRQIDIEMWMPGQEKYRETHSADLMGEYQARRLGIRVKRDAGGKEFVHMNDATVFAMGRTLIAILENYQNEDGSISVPVVLQSYMGGIERITRE